VARAVLHAYRRATTLTQEILDIGYDNCPAQAVPPSPFCFALESMAEILAEAGFGSLSDMQRLTYQEERDDWPLNPRENAAHDMTAPVADRVNELFDVMHAAGEPPRTNRDVAEQVARRSRTSFTEEDLRSLRAGAKHNVTAQQLRSLAECFGVQARFLVAVDGDAEVAAQLRLLKAVRDHGVRDLGCCGRLVPDPADVDAVTALAGIVSRLGQVES
jgi:hypothetical protein